MHFNCVNSVINWQLLVKILFVSEFDDPDLLISIHFCITCS